MRGGGVQRYVESLLRGRRPRPFQARPEEAAEVRAAIMLRAARPGVDAPREGFVASLHERLAHQMREAEEEDADARGADAHTAAPGRARRWWASGPFATRRRFLRTASIAAAAGVGVGVGMGVENLVGGSGGGTPAASGTWQTVATTAELTDGTVRPFDFGTAAGFVERRGTSLIALSGYCTHARCRLVLNAAAQQFDCVCHTAAFALTGENISYGGYPGGPTTLPPLPRMAVRESDGQVQVYIPAQTNTAAPITSEPSEGLNAPEA